MKHIFIFTLVIVLLLSFSCKKKNIKENYEGNVIYTIKLVSSETLVGKSFSKIDTAKVELSINDSTYILGVDENGIAVFNHIPTGYASVSIESEGFSSVNYIVNFPVLSAEENIYNYTTNLRNISSTVTLFSTSGSGMATIKGKAFADLDLTLAGNEVISENLNIKASVADNQYHNFIKHSEDSTLSNIIYNDVLFSSQINSSGDYSINVPASISGIDIVITGDDFVYNQKISASETKRKVYKLNSDTIKVFSNSIKISDLVWE